MPMITAMSTKGQIVLPKKIRMALNLNAGTQFIVFSYNDSILLKPIKEPKLAEFEAVLGKFQNWAKEVGVTEADIDEAVKAVRKNKRKA
jgi:antitoxin PrlF